VRVCLACWNRLSSKKATFSIRARRAGAEQTDLVFLLAEMPACLWAFKTLTTLNLASNDLRAIPAEVSSRALSISLSLFLFLFFKISFFFVDWAYDRPDGFNFGG
jgi:hypothetical protein